MSTNDILNNSLPLPVDSMPECWSKDERMNALFAEFRNRSVNSQDWDSKLKFWAKFISDWLSCKHRCSFSISELNVAFKRKGQTPRCLTTVVEELLRKREIISETEFVKESCSGWTAWAIDAMVKKPVVWSFSKLKNYIVKDTIGLNNKYVHLKTVEELGDLILSTVDENHENVLVSLSRVTKNCIDKSGDDSITTENIKLALLWLRRSKKVAFGCDFIHDKTDFLVKISSKGAKELSEAEEGLFKLMEQEKLIIKNVEKSEAERNAVVVKAKSCLAAGMREVAKACIRKKREIDRNIEKRLIALHNVQTLIGRINDAHSNTEILAAYKTGSVILKNFESGGLSEENVINAMDDMSEVVSEFSELQSIMSTSVGTIDADADLEDELQELLNDSSLEIDEKEEKKDTKPSLPKIDNLPDLEKELSSLNIQDFPNPPETSTQNSSVNVLRQKDCVS